MLTKFNIGWKTRSKYYGFHIMNLGIKINCITTFSIHICKSVLAGGRGGGQWCFCLFCSYISLKILDNNLGVSSYGQTKILTAQKLTRGPFELHSTVQQIIWTWSVWPFKVYWILTDKYLKCPALPVEHFGSALLPWL